MHPHKASNDADHLDTDAAVCDVVNKSMLKQPGMTQHCPFVHPAGISWSAQRSPGRVRCTARALPAV